MLPLIFLQLVQFTASRGWVGSKVTTAVSFQAADAVGLESCLTELIQTLHRNQIEKVVEQRHSTGSRMKDTSAGVA
ncbi:hypothetical protein D917_08810, partial [Trichinella nativa]